MPDTRDFAMARLAAVKVSVTAANDAIDACLHAFVGPETDPTGKTRRDTLNAAIEALGCATRAAEAAEDVLLNEAVDWSRQEPWV